MNLCVRARSVKLFYDGAPHAYYADHRSICRKQAAEDGYKRMLAWFKQYGVA